MDRFWDLLMGEPTTDMRICASENPLARLVLVKPKCRKLRIIRPLWDDP